MHYKGGGRQMGISQSHICDENSAASLTLKVIEDKKLCKIIMIGSKTIIFSSTRKEIKDRKNLHQ